MVNGGDPLGMGEGAWCTGVVAHGSLLGRTRITKSQGDLQEGGGGQESAWDVRDSIKITTKANRVITGSFSNMFNMISNHFNRWFWRIGTICESRDKCNAYSPTIFWNTFQNFIWYLQEVRRDQQNQGKRKSAEIERTKKIGPEPEDFSQLCDFFFQLWDSEFGRPGELGGLGQAGNKKIVLKEMDILEVEGLAMRGLTFLAVGQRA